ncbi:hypothetical protein J8J14_12530 [Roseomonas sp. SSH11]|uniref:Uncharacterized protein n=1 Tax=Pararoseomonas baculiformis TaxID=2820812 RepID=A0ABS4AF16_9PROT|nr:hypothetical protein [Pararoseomonas baculiformis]MBP0445602.1 hypothetical protein [Pararoseomonas baculiformis]
MSKAPAGKAGAAPRKPAASRPAISGKAASPRKGSRSGAAGALGWRSRLARGPSWIGVALIVLAVLVILPIVAAVLGDIWAVILAALVGGFALGRATA